MEKKKRIYTPKEVTIGRSLAYGLTDVMGGAAFTIVGAFLLYFFTTFAGLTAVEGAAIIGIARIVDAITSLVMGSLTDNFYKTKLGKRFGRRHFWLLIGSPLMLEYVLMWVTGMNFWYYLIVYLLFEIIAASVLIPWETLPTEMTTDYKARTKMSTCRMFISATGTFLATFVPGQIINMMGQHNSYAYFVNALVFALIFAACIMASNLATWEREITPEMEAEFAKAPKLGLWGGLKKQVKDYLSTLKIKSFRKHLLIYLFSFTGKDVYNTIFVYFGVSCLGISATNSANILSLSFVGILVTVIAGFLMVKKGPRFLFLSGYSIMFLMLGAFYMIYRVKPDNIMMWLMIVGLIYQVGRATLEFTPWNVFPFIPDLDEIVTKQHREGIYAAVMTFVRKSTVAIATFVVGLVLQSGGYKEGQTVQSIGTQDTIVSILIIGTGGLILIAFCVALTFKLNRETHDILVDEMNRLKEGGSKADVTPEAKEVVEELTGFKYDQVWNEDNAK